MSLVVRSLVIQGFDLRDGFTSKHLCGPRDATLTRPAGLRYSTIERANELAQR